MTTTFEKKRASLFPLLPHLQAAWADISAVGLPCVTRHRRCVEYARSAFENAAAPRMPVTENAASAREARLDDAFERALAAVVAYEDRRAALHAELAAARFAMMAATLALSRRYATLSIGDVPQDIVASFRTTLAAPGGDNGHAAVAVRAAAAPASDGAPADKLGQLSSAGGEAARGALDPAMWFSLAPPSEVRDCERQFRGAAELACEVVTARIAAEALLDEYGAMRAAARAS
jgi:hypothetical protein